MFKRAILTGAIFAMLAVMLGAFGAHGLKSAQGITPENLQTFDTGVRYQFYHAIALILLGILVKLVGENKLLRASYIFFIIGIIFFSGSLYGLSTQNMLGINAGFLGPVTPLGGLCFIAGWLLLILSFARSKSQ